MTPLNHVANPSWFRLRDCKADLKANNLYDDTLCKLECPHHLGCKMICVDDNDVKMYKLRTGMK